MLVTFHSKDYYPITMFGEPALALIRLMGLPSKVPGAIYAEDVPQALWQLQEALAAEPDTHDIPADEPAQELPVSLRQRAVPLLEMLQAAAKSQHPIHWD